MRLKNNTRQRKKSIQGLRSFKDSLPKNIKETIFKKAKIYSKIVDNWKKIVGNDSTKPISSELTAVIVSICSKDAAFMFLSSSFTRGLCRC